MVPKVGDRYYPQFEEDYSLPLSSASLTIAKVIQRYDDDKGFEIVASDGIGYDCYWSKRLNAWCYYAST